MKTRKIRILIHLAVLGLLIVSCSSEDGATGPAGPSGPQGEQGTAGADGTDGADGADGEQGDQGETGTANVIYSGWIDSEFANDIVTTSASFSIDVPLLTDDIINQGVVLVFGRSNPAPVTNDTDVFALPIVFGASLQQSHYFRVEQAEQLDIVVVANEEGESVGTPFLGEYRYIIIPGGNPAGGPGAGGGLGSKGGAVDYTKMSYEEITDHFGIK
nr:hypothetical protein [uncultured Allomuricauda sp.]